MLRGQGSAWALRQPCPASRLSSGRLAKSLSRTRGEAFRENLDPLAQWGTRDRNDPLSVVEPRGVSREWSWDDPRVPHAPDTALSPPRVPATLRRIRSRVSSSLCKWQNLPLVTDGGVRLVSLGFAVKLFKTDLDVATLFLQ